MLSVTQDHLVPLPDWSGSCVLHPGPGGEGQATGSLGLNLAVLHLGFHICKMGGLHGTYESTEHLTDAVIRLMLMWWMVTKG